MMSEVMKRNTTLTQLNLSGKEIEKELNQIMRGKQKTSKELAIELLPKIKERLLSVKEWNNGNLFETLVALSSEVGVKKQALLWITRIAITGREATAGGATEIADVLGKEETVKRIDFSISLLQK